MTDFKDRSVNAIARANQKSYEKLAYFRDVMKRFEGSEKKVDILENKMKIIDKREYKGEVLFSDLEIGDYFEVNGNLCLKLGLSGMPLNVLEIKTTTYADLQKDYLVVPLNTTLIIE